MAADRRQHSQDLRLGMLGNVLCPSLLRTSPIQEEGGRQLAAGFSLLDSLLCLAWDLVLPGREGCHKA
jgi:hypothetical protein